jgi:hypothetical protein
MGRINGLIGGTRTPDSTMTSCGGVNTLRQQYDWTQRGRWITTTPESVAGLVCWLDAADASTMYNATSGGSLVSDGGQILRMEDKSGNGKHFTKASNCPTRQSAQQNGLGVVRFNGTNNYLQNASFPYMTTSGYTAVFVAKSDSAADRWFMTGIIAGSDDDYLTVMLRRNNGGDTKNQFFHRVVDTPVEEVYNIATHNVYVMRVGGGNLSVWRNETLLGTQSVTSTSARTILNIGALVRPSNPTGTLFFQGDLAELAWYDNAISSDDRSNLTQQLKLKWGIA